MTSGANRSARVHWSLEQAVLGLALLAGFPAAAALAWIVWGQNYSFEVRWTLAAIVVVVWVGCAIVAYQMVTRVLYLAANLLGALHEGDGSNCGGRRSVATASRTSSSSLPISAARCAKKNNRPGSASSACSRTKSTIR